MVCHHVVAAALRLKSTTLAETIESIAYEQKLLYG